MTSLRCFIIKIALIALVLLSLSGATLGQVRPSEKMVSNEAAMWKFDPAENMAIAYFPCTLISCEEYKVRDAIYKAYFPDGFVLTLSSSGNVLRHYYLPSRQHESALKRNRELYLGSEFESFPEEIRKRLKIRVSEMDKFFMAEYRLIEILHDFNLGKFNEAANLSTIVIAQKTSLIGINMKEEDGTLVIAEIKESSPAQKAGLQVGDRILKINGQPVTLSDLRELFRALRREEPTVIFTVQRKKWDKPKDIVLEVSYWTRHSSEKDPPLAAVFAIRALAEKELGATQAFFRDAERAFILDPKNEWARRAIVFTHIEKGRYDEALKVLSQKKDSFDRLLEGIVYSKAGDMNKAVDAFSQVGDDLFETKSVFYQNYIALAKALWKPYKEAILKSAKDNEAKGQLREAIRNYSSYLQLADEKEAKMVRNHIADLIAKHPHMFALPEEARRMVIRAETYTQDGQFEKAIEEYKRALKIQPFFPLIYKALALNYAQVKNFNQAIKNMSIYLELYPDAPDARAAKDEIYRWELRMEKGD
ncbi:MAG: PDZ domain-containing protein [Desulfobacterota bacterium]|nr:PDZ domain-containing protein [Thermodesulfobacteriota bacterium]MDW8001691.1 PDZ domain-containing protein [Deltaproteobacteria bacterium]